MDGKVFSKEVKDWLAKVADDAIKFPWFLETLDNKLFGMLIDLLDKKGDKFIPDSIDVYLNDALLFCKEEKWEDASVQLATAINKLIDVPNVDEDKEQQWFISLAQAIISLVQLWVSKK